MLTTRWMRRVRLAGIVLGCGCSVLLGQKPPADMRDSSSGPDPMDEPLITDRPDFTESTESVPAGHFQLEVGYLFTHDREDDVRVRDHSPELLLRIGVVEDFELRIGWSAYSFTETQFSDRSTVGRPFTREDWDQGANDLSLGFKLKLLEQDGWVPHFGILGELNLPTGSAGFAAEDVQPKIGLLWAYDLTDDVGLAGNLNFAVTNDEGDQFLQTSASLSLAVTLTDQLGAYVEYFGFYPGAEDSDMAHSLNGGLTYLITKDFQLDARAGFGLNEQADDFFAGVGFSWRY